MVESCEVGGCYKVALRPSAARESSSSRFERKMSDSSMDSSDIDSTAESCVTVELEPSAPNDVPRPFSPSALPSSSTQHPNPKVMEMNLIAEIDRDLESVTRAMIGPVYPRQKGNTLQGYIREFLAVRARHPDVYESLEDRNYRFIHGLNSRMRERMTMDYSRPWHEVVEEAERVDAFLDEIYTVLDAEGDGRPLPPEIQAIKDRIDPVDYNRELVFYPYDPEDSD